MTHTLPPALSDSCLSGHIAALWVFPIKSCAGIACTQAVVHAHGLAWDRHWMVMTADGQFLSQREAPHMARIVPQIDEAQGVLRVDAAGQPTLELPLAAPSAPATVPAEVWGDACAVWDMGDAAAHWFTQAVGQACRLVRANPAQPRLTSGKWTHGARAPVLLSDGYPLLITTEAAVDDLNTRLQAQGHAAVDGLRFRANIVLGGFGPHDEDFSELLWVHSADGAVALHPCKPCARCPIPNIDPATGHSSPEVSAALQGYRADARVGGAITFGMNAVVRQGAGTLVRVGDAVGATLAWA